ncbi:MAG: hypothetical protein IPM69_05375 [Ignavibacteria bacterium]|nr:hypothetical protein [Ignavibacteria bacterium]
MWAAPAIIPYPLSKIAVEIESGNLDVAVEVLVNYCDIKFLRNIIDDWYTLDAFHKRKQLIEDAFFAHTNEKYTLSINALLPHIEGIITDWMYSNVEAGKIPWRQDSKTKIFGQIIMEGQLSSYSYNSIIKSTIQFITQGPVLETFKQWEQQVDNAFPNRHVIEHGKYIDELYTIENSIRLFLLLDTISYIIKK